MEFACPQGHVNRPPPSLGINQAVPAQPTLRLWSHPLKAGTRKLREVMEPLAGTSLQENRILSSTEKLGQGQGRGRTGSKCQELATSTHWRVWEEEGVYCRGRD